MSGKTRLSDRRGTPPGNDLIWSEHLRSEAICEFADGNGILGRAAFSCQSLWTINIGRF